MASGQTLRRRHAGRMGQPPTGTPKDGVTIDESGARASSGELPTGPVEAPAGRTDSCEAEIPAAAFTAWEPAVLGPPPGVPARPPVMVHGYVRAPARESPGIIRAAVEPTRPAAEPLFSNEGILREQKTLRASWRDRILGPVAGAAVALRAAGAALGHNAGSRLSSGNPRKKRRVSPFWLISASLCVLLALVIGTNLVSGTATAAWSQAPRSVVTTPMPYVGGSVTGSPTSAVRESTGPTSSTGGGVISNGSPSAGVSSTPTGAPTSTFGTTPKPNPVPTPIHTPAPVITPPPTTTPVPTPTATPVMFATIVQATPPTAHGSDATFVVQSLPTATCTLTATRPGPGGHHTLNNITIGGDGSSGPFAWGGTWAKGTYQVTARCQMPSPDHRSITSTAVPITMP